jgi:hypothetical protein
VRDDFARLEAALSSREAREGRAISDLEAQQLIELIVSMYDRLVTYRADRP